MSKNLRNLIIIGTFMLLTVAGTAFVSSQYKKRSPAELQDISSKNYLTLYRRRLHNAVMNRRYSEADILIRRIFKLAPQDPAARQLAGKVFYHNRKYAEAENILHKQLMKAPSDAVCRSNYGMVMAAMDRPRQALDELNRAYRESKLNFIRENLLFAAKKFNIKIQVAPDYGGPLLPPPYAISAAEEQ